MQAALKQLRRQLEAGVAKQRRRKISARQGRSRRRALGLQIERLEAWLGVVPPAAAAGTALAGAAHGRRGAPEPEPQATSDGGRCRAQPVVAEGEAGGEGWNAFFPLLNLFDA